MGNVGRRDGREREAKEIRERVGEKEILGKKYSYEETARRKDRGIQLACCKRG